MIHEFKKFNDKTAEQEVFTSAAMIANGWLCAR